MPDGKVKLLPEAVSWAYNRTKTPKSRLAGTLQKESDMVGGLAYWDVFAVCVLEESLILELLQVSEKIFWVL